MNAKKMILPLLLALPMVGEGQALAGPGSAYPGPRGAINRGSGAKTRTLDLIDLAGVSEGCKASGATISGHTLTIVRTGVASYFTAAGALADCAANTAAVTGWGIFGQPTRTNAFTSPEVPATQDLSLPAGLSFSCFVSATNTAQLRVCNPTAAPIDPPSATYSVRTTP